jgi:hypothetical protein
MNQRADQPSGGIMHPSANIVVLVTTLGKAAVGGAGLTLAALGAMDAVLGAVAAAAAGMGHTFMENVGTLVPYLAILGAMANAAWTYRRLRSH